MGLLDHTRKAELGMTCAVEATVTHGVFGEGSGTVGADLQQLIAFLLGKR